MSKRFATLLLGVCLASGLSACSPGVYYPFGGGPNGQHYAPPTSSPASPAVIAS